MDTIATHRADSNAQPLMFQLEGSRLAGAVAMPEDARGLVVFARARGGTRVAGPSYGLPQMLEAAGIGSLLLDLMTPGEECEEADGALRRFDVELLAQRLLACTDALRAHDLSNGTPIGYFGVGTGAAAALAAAAEDPAVGAVVCQAGLPNLLPESTLARLRAPTLLLVGDSAKRLVEVNRAACRWLGGPSRLSVVEGTRHGFTPVRAQAELTWRAADWFRYHLGRGTERGASRGEEVAPARSQVS